MINGQEVSDMVHDDVVNLIRAARDIENNSKLVLTVQQRGILYLLPYDYDNSIIYYRLRYIQDRLTLLIILYKIISDNYILKFYK